MISLLPLDVGFDLRKHHIMVRITSHSVKFMSETGISCVIAEDPQHLGNELADAGYCVVVGTTPKYTDVQCTPRLHAPVGKKYIGNWSGPVWAAQHKDSNEWCLAPTLDKVLAMSGWSMEEIRFFEVVNDNSRISR